MDGPGRHRIGRPAILVSQGPETNRPCHSVKDRLDLLKDILMERVSQSSCVPQGHYAVKQDSLGVVSEERGLDKTTPLTGR